MPILTQQQQSTLIAQMHAAGWTAQNTSNPTRFVDSMGQDHVTVDHGRLPLSQGIRVLRSRHWYTAAGPLKHTHYAERHGQLHQFDIVDSQDMPAADPQGANYLLALQVAGAL